MRFTIRDLLWLMAVVGLAATVFTDREHMRRQRLQLAEEKKKIEDDASAAVAAAQKRLGPLRHENAILRHQAVVQMEKRVELERRLELAAQRHDPAPETTPFRPITAPVSALLESTEAER